MSDTRELLRETRDRIAPPSDVLGMLERRRHRQQQVRRGSAFVVAIVVALIGVGGWIAIVGRDVAEVPADHVLTVLRRGGEVIETRDRDPALVAIDPVTGETRLLVAGDDIGVKFFGEAAWSPDGKWFAFLAHPHARAFGSAQDGGWRLWVADSDGPRQIGSQDFGGHGDWPDPSLVWSPAGPRLVSIQGSALVMVDASTGRVTDLGSTGAGHHATSAPVWSPDGTQILFGSRHDLFSVDVATGDRTLLFSPPGFVEDIEWSPDGAYVAVQVGPGQSGDVLGAEPVRRLYVMDADGSNLRVLVDGYAAGWASRVSFSPDGTRIAYTSLVRPDPEGDRGTLEVWTVPVDGSDPSLVISQPEEDCCAGPPVWSPDGSQIGFGGDKGFFAVKAAGSGDARLMDDLLYASWLGGYRLCCGA